jgi:hypothetical protein
MLWDVGPHPLERNRPLREVAGHDHPVGTHKRRLPREHLVRNDAEPVEIAPAVHQFAGRLLRAHVGRRTDGDPLPRRRVFGVPVRCAGDSEIGEQRAARDAVEQDVLGLHVAVHEPRTAGRIECGGEVGCDCRRPVGRQRAIAGEKLAQGFPRHLVHHVEVQVTCPAGLMDRDDVGMADPREHTRFRQEPVGDRGLLGELGMGNLDRNPPVEGAVGSLIDHTHPAPAELLLQPVVRLQRRLNGGEQVHSRFVHVTRAPCRLDAIPRHRVACASPARAIERGLNGPT